MFTADKLAAGRYTCSHGQRAYVPPSRRRRPSCHLPIYDPHGKVMFEDNRQNRLLEALDLYEEVVSNPIFR